MSVSHCLPLCFPLHVSWSSRRPSRTPDSLSTSCSTPVRPSLTLTSHTVHQLQHAQDVSRTRGIFAHSSHGVRPSLLFLIISPALCSRTLPVFVLSRCLCTREAARAHDGRCRRAIAWPLWCGNTGYRRSGPEVEPVTRGCTAVPRHGEDTRAASKVFSTPARTAESAPKSAGQAHPGVQPSAHGQKQNRRYVQAEHRHPPQRARSRVLSKSATQAHSGATPARTVAGPFEIGRSGTSRCHPSTHGRRSFRYPPVRHLQVASPALIVKCPGGTRLLFLLKLRQ